MHTVNCSSPPAVDGLVIEPYNDTTEGAVVYYHYDSDCDASQLHPLADNLEQRMVTCTSDGIWSLLLQSEEITMQAVFQLHDIFEFGKQHIYLSAGDMDCEPQTNTGVINKTEIIFQCDKGSGKFIALCTQDSDRNCFALPACGNKSETGILIS